MLQRVITCHVRQSKLQGRNTVQTLAPLLSTEATEDFCFVVSIRIGHDNHLQIFVKVQTVERERN